MKSSRKFLRSEEEKKIQKRPYQQYSKSPYGQNVTFGQTPASSSIGRNRTSSSSSSSSSERNRNLGVGPSTSQNTNQFVQHSTLSQPIQQPIGNVQTGYGSTTVPTTNMYDSTQTGSNIPLGKNLYGQTGYVSPKYQVQQPFPGQTVYVQKSSQKISQKTKQKFDKSII